MQQFIHNLKSNKKSDEFVLFNTRLDLNFFEYFELISSVVKRLKNLIPIGEILKGRGLTGLIIHLTYKFI